MTNNKSWMRFKTNEVEKLVIKEAKHGKKPSLIGMTLRDSYGIPDVHQITGRNITQILKENKLNENIPEDLFYMIKKALNIREHMEHNKKDVPAKRSLLRIEARIRKAVKYNIKNGKLPKDWKYEPSKVKLLLH